MSRVSTYLNFQGRAEEAFDTYARLFGTQYDGEIIRMVDMGAPGLTEAEQGLVGHAALPILAGHVLMATDMLESMGQQLVVGNNTTINLELDERSEADRLYAALSEGGSDSSGMQEMPWGYWGCTLDRFGIRWMFNVANPT
jgi:PhnB protein